VVQTLRLSLYTTLIAVPLGVAFALGINRWRGVTAASFNFVMILSYVIPELIFGVAMFFVFTALFTFVHLGTLAQTLALVTVPLGVAFALGINRWRGKTASSANFLMILSFVIPELIFGVAMFFVFTKLFKPIGLGTLAEVLALVSWNVSWPALIVQARLVTLGRQYEEAAADLGAAPWQVIYRVLWPLLRPAIFASAVLVFSGVIDDFVLVDLLSSNSGNTPMSVYIYSQQRGGNGGPALNALGTIMLVMSFVIAIIGYIGYRFMTRGERGGRIEALTTIVGSEG